MGETWLKIIGYYNPRGGRRKKTNLRPVLLLLMLILFVSAVIFILKALKSPTYYEDANISYIGDIPVIEEFIEEGAVARTGIKREIKYIVIHETDNFAAGANAAAHDVFIRQNGATNALSWHYTVDQSEIYHHLPDDEAAYHAGDHLDKDGGNLNGIGIEMCVNEDNDYEKTLDNTAELCAALMLSYDLTPRALRKHEDFSGKVCPARLINEGRWDEFAEKVQVAYDKMKQAQAED